MSRPEPEIIDSVEDEDGTQWQILAAQATYMVTYKGEPVSVRNQNLQLGKIYRKYRKMSYPNYASAVLQARRLNKRFNTDLFAVRELII